MFTAAAGRSGMFARAEPNVPAAPGPAAGAPLLGRAGPGDGIRLVMNPGDHTVLTLQGPLPDGVSVDIAVLARSAQIAPGGPEPAQRPDADASSTKVLLRNVCRFGLGALGVGFSLALIVVSLAQPEERDRLLAGGFLGLAVSVPCVGLCLLNGDGPRPLR